LATNSPCSFNVTFHVNGSQMIGAYSSMNCAEPRAGTFVITKH
jgi:hypothetical protein